MSLRYRIILFTAVLIWTAGIFYESFIGLFNPLIYGYTFAHQTYSLVCHQDPQKLIDTGSGISLVCARCTGIYSGLLVLSTIFLFYRWKLKANLKLLFIFITPMLLDVLLVMAGLYNYSRTAAFTTGFLSGSILFLYLCEGLEKLISELKFG